MCVKKPISVTKMVFLLNTEHIGKLGKGHVVLTSSYDVPTLKFGRLNGGIWACSEKAFSLRTHCLQEVLLGEHVNLQHMQS